jgi:transposase InsO family protein
MSKEFHIEKLSSAANYHTWAFEIENLLRLKKLLKYTQQDGEVGDEKVEECRAILSLTIDKQLFPLIRRLESPKEIWETLKNRFEEKGLTRKIGLLRSLISTRLDGDMNVFLNTIMDAANKLSNIGFEISSDWLVAIILAGLDESYKPFIMGLEASAAELTPDELAAKLLDNTSNDQKNSALLANKPKKSGKSGKSWKCFGCGKRGHTKSFCPEKKDAAEQNAKLAFLSVAETKKNLNKENCATAFLSKGSSTEWYVDSGATTHMTSIGSLLKTKREADVTKIMCASGDGLEVKSVGPSSFKVNGREVELPNVLHVPGLAANLLSVSRIVENGNKVTFDKTGCVIKDQSNNTIAKCKATHGVYKLNLSFAATTDKTKTVDAFKWHRMLGHSNAEYVKKYLKANNIVVETNSLHKIKNCVVCAEGKQCRPPFERSVTQTSKVLELVHSDVMGPMETKTVGGARYALTFVDDFSGMVFVRFMKEKSEVFDAFCEFKNMAENQTGCKIKKFRSDNGTEFLNKRMEKVMLESGIVHQKTAPYTPQQNGKAERMNRTLVEKAKCLLFDADLHKRFWGEAMSMAAFLINNTYLNEKGKTPSELFQNQKMDASNLKRFGTKIMVQVPKVKRQKWDKNSQSLIFVGYDAESKAYRCVDKSTGKLTISRDVKFLEEDQTQTFSTEADPEVAAVKIDPVEEGKVDAETAGVDSNADQVVHDIGVGENIEDIKPANEGEADNAEDDTEDDIEDDAEDDTEDDIENEVAEEDQTFDDESRDPNYQPTLSSSEQLPSQPAEGTRSKVKQLNPFNFGNFGFFTAEPSCAKEAKNDPNWREAMEEEMKAHAINQTWTLQDLPSGRKTVKSKWVFKTKVNNLGEVVRHKARLVAKGYSQREGIDYHETFAPVVRYASIRCLMALAVRNKMYIHQMDAVTAFLQGDLNEEIYMDQPEEYSDGSNRVCRLQKTIYGLKQASREWNSKLDSALIRYGVCRSKMDPCVYYRKDLSLILAVYVDDFLIFYKDEKMLKNIKKYLCENFLMKDLGTAKSCLGIKITQKDFNITLDQSRYILEILGKFGLSEAKPVGTPVSTSHKLTKHVDPDKSLVGKVPYQEAIGSLLFIANCTRPDISFAVSELSKYNLNHDGTHWMAVKRVFRYLRGTVDMQLCYKEPMAELEGYCDADWASDVEERRSCTGYLFKMSGGAISWRSKRQATIALSSTEAEYMAMSESGCEVIWLRQLLGELLGELKKPTTIYCDNESAIKLSQSDAYRPRSKHIDIRHHHVRQLADRNIVKIQHLSTKIMIADSLTKAVSKEKTEFCSKSMGLK